MIRWREQVIIKFLFVIYPVIVVYVYRDNLMSINGKKLWILNIDMTETLKVIEP